ncbi:uncharacterized protein (DUF885 family) [Natranaerovirga pectinivora]|uniref:Uncharacterized protein (DUF885 family) n=1 Tax=Natranaerovirga pectinivora TaxID=682400 RepID=A0A4R3MEU1_9FIRM|nr:DUF885 domain-containing protein [Natranaerovirga pectinivora]TCT11672.1 uncharacterized protein (DUF885 family) [Natranaerovirga pectinivora]
MKCHFKKIFTIFFVFLLLLSIIGCSKKPTVTPDENAEFAMFLDNLFKSELESSPLDIAYTLASPENYNLDHIIPSMPDLSEEAFLKDIQRIENIINELKTFDYENLSTDEKLTYDILMKYYEVALMSKNLYKHRKILSPSLGMQSQLPIFFAEYPLRIKKDINNYLNLLNEVPILFNQVIEFERLKATEGLLMPAFAMESIIEQINYFTSSVEDNFLIEIFIDKIKDIPGITADDITQFENRNRDLIINTVIPAYEELALALTQLKDKSVNNKGLYYLPQGTDYYEYLYYSYTGSSKTLEEIIDLIDLRIRQTFVQYHVLSQQDVDLIDAYFEFSYKIDSPENTINFLIESMNTYFTNVGNPALDIKYVHPSLQEHLSPAFYLIPPIDGESNQVIYINNNQKYDLDNLYPTIAHETYPGHLYQYIYFRQQDVPRIRQILNYPGYSEGWAIYAENFSIGFLDIQDSLSQILQYDRKIDLLIQGRIDIGVNYEGWAVEDVATYLDSLYLNLDIEVIKNIFQYVIEEPANTLKYSIGYLEVLLLQEKAASLNSDFDIKDFHDFILSIGPAPYEIIERELEKWLKNK